MGGHKSERGSQLPTRVVNLVDRAKPDRTFLPIMGPCCSICHPRRDHDGQMYYSLQICCLRDG